MKKYDLVIFGSTFFAAGLCSAYKGSSLIIEPKTKPGYEFIDAFYPGDYCNYSPTTREGKEFYDYLKDNHLTENSYILRWTPYIALWLTHINAPHIFLTDITDVKNFDDGYIITIFNSMGKSEIFAKKIIDTRTTDYNYKTINFLTKGGNVIPSAKGIKMLCTYRDFSIYQVEVADGEDYPHARKKAVKAFEYLKELSSDISIVAIADEMYKRADCPTREISPGYIKCCSSYYDNPVKAFDMGAMKGGELL